MVLSESHRLSGWRARKIPVLTLKQEHPLRSGCFLKSFDGFGTLQGADQEKTSHFGLQKVMGKRMHSLRQSGEAELENWGEGGRDTVSTSHQKCEGQAEGWGHTGSCSPDASLCTKRMIYKAWETFLLGESQLCDAEINNWIVIWSGSLLREPER